MRMHLLFGAILLTLQLSCNTNEPNPPYDREFLVRGLVVDVSSSRVLSGVTVGYRYPQVPDSLVFKGDSLQSLREDCVPVHALTLSDGSYELKFYPGVRDTSRYRCLFAYKTGFRVWRSDRDTVELARLSEYSDQVNVGLVSR